MTRVETHIVPLDETIRFLTNIGAKFAGRAIYVWGSESRIADPAFFRYARRAARAIHAADPEFIVQAAVFEAVSREVETIPVPDWVFKEFSLQPEKRCFRYQEMLYPDGHYVDEWGAGCSVPDITRVETQMWLYWLAASYIDIGAEGIHFGQVELMSEQDWEFRHWWDLVGRVREYAQGHARRHWVLCDAHVRKTHGIVVDGRLMLDFHSRPIRGIVETEGEPLHATLEMGYLDSIFGRSRGGIAPSGWTCDHLPYLVEFDNWGSGGTGGQNIGGIWVWGYDEISWFAHLESEYRNFWLRYAWDWLSKNDPNGHLQMPGCRGLADPVDGKERYYANTPSEACLDGFNQEDTVKAIWEKDVRQDNETRSYAFDGPMSRQVLENYLSHAVTQTNLLISLGGEDSSPDGFGHP